MRSRFLVGAAVALASLSLVGGGVQAKGGAGGGGGGTGGGGVAAAPKFSPIQPVSTTVTCSKGTVLSVSLRKGFDKRVEVVVVPVAGATNPDGSPVASAWWNQQLMNDTTGSSLGGWGGNIDLVPGLRQTVLLSGVRSGSSQLTYSAARRTLPAGPIDPSAIALLPVQETCSATLTVVAK